MSKFDNNPTWVVLMWVVVSIAAVNWALVAQFDVNLVTELLGSNDYYAFMAIGLIGAIDLLETFGFVSIYE